MNQLTIFSVAILCLTPFVGLRAEPQFSTHMFHHSSRARKEVGNFLLLAKGKHSTIFLENNKFYHPLGRLNKQKVRKWQLSDTVRVLKTKKKHVYVLANLTNGETANAKLSPRVHSPLGTFPLLAKACHARILLGNNVLYQPLGPTNVQKVRGWQLSDTVRVLKTKDENKYELVNLNRGEFVVAKVKGLQSLQSSCNSSSK